MSSEALLTEALKMIAGSEDGDEDETDQEDGGDTDDGTAKKRSKSHKHKKSKKKKHKKEKKRKREKEREEYDSEEGDRQKSEHHRKKKRRDKDREEEEEEGEIRKIKIEVKQEKDDVWYPGDDRRDFESKRVIRRYPTPPRGFDEGQGDGHRSHREESRSHRDREESRSHREESRSHREEPRSHRDEPSSHRDDSRSGRDDSRSHRDDSRSHRDDSRSHKKSRHSPSPSGSRDHGKKRSRRSRSRSRERRSRSGERRSQQPRPPVRKEDSGGDSFWDTKFEATELGKKIDKQEKKGLHYLDMEEVDVRRAFRTPTPEREKRKKGDKRTPSPECDELRRLRELKEMQELTVKEDEKYVKEPLDPKLFEWNSKTKMWARKQKPDEEATKFTAAITYEDELRKAMEKQFGEGKRSKSRSASPELKRLAIEGPKERNIEDMPNSQLTMDEIEKIKRKKKANEILKKEEDDKKERREKRDKKKKDEKSEEKEEGEYNSEDEERCKRKKSKKKRRSRSPRSRSRDRVRKLLGVPSASANMAPIGSGGRSGRGRSSRSRSPPGRGGGRGGFGFKMSRSRSRSPRAGRRGGFGWSGGRSRSRSWSPARRGGFGSRRSRSRSRDRYRGRGRSRSRSRSRDGGWRSGGRRGKRYMSRSRSRDRGFRGSRTAVDKEKLLAIAKKNAVKLLSSDNLMGMDEDRLKAIKSGGHSLSQLTQFCKDLVKKGITDEFSDEFSGSEDEVHHPFAVSDKGGVPNPIFGKFGASGLAVETMLNPTMKAAAKSHRMIEFPVSSGNAHRVKEAEFTAEIEFEAKLALEGPSEVELNKKAEEEAKAIEERILEAKRKSAAEVAAAQVAAAKNEKKEEDDKRTLAEMANAQNPLGVLMFGGAKEPEEVEKELVEAGIFEKKEAEAEVEAEGDDGTTKPEPEADKKPEEAAVPSTSSAPAPVPTPAPAPPQLGPISGSVTTLAIPAPKADKETTKDLKAFEHPVENPVGDISAIVSQRLAAMRKLDENPNDADALAAMYKAQKQMSTWAESKNKPGQFTGHTGAKVLSRHELNLGVQAYARQDQFTNAKKVQGGFGEYLLRKMGWSEGDGLGKNRDGEVDPLTMEIKFDKKGLQAAEEGVMRRKKGDALTLTGCKDISGKHPVSALIEVSTKRRWGQPSFVQAFECGHSHKKQYIFKVTVDGKAYQPSVACDNKKKAKADAATYALQQLGFMAVDPNNPL